MTERARRSWMLAGWTALNRTFRPVMGPAQLGPFNEAPLPAPDAKPCPLCGRPMTEHTMARSSDQSVATRLRCPTAS